MSGENRLWFEQRLAMLPTERRIGMALQMQRIKEDEDRLLAKLTEITSLPESTTEEFVAKEEKLDAHNKELEALNEEINIIADELGVHDFSDPEPAPESAVGRDSVFDGNHRHRSSWF
jgi:chromosome segregation ATPase